MPTWNGDLLEIFPAMPGKRLNSPKDWTDHHKGYLRNEF
jgi:hypothetical protein